MRLDIILPIILVLGLLTAFIIIRKMKKKVDSGVHPLEITEENMIEYTPIIDGLTQFEGKLLNIINSYRISIGLDELLSERLCRNLAYDHTKFMISEGKPSHVNAFKRRYELFRRGATRFSENVGADYNSPESFFGGYMSSEPHKDAIEEIDYTHIGIRTLKNLDGIYYNAIVFATFK